MFKDMKLALERIEKRQRVILEKLEELEKGGSRPDRPEAGPYKGQGKDCRWIESGIDSILAYQVGKKKGSEQG